MPYETAVFDWRAGDRAVQSAAPDERLAMERVVEALMAELRRRIGITFTVDELACHYDQGTDWCLEIAQRVAPDAPWAWDAAIVADAAFHRYLRGASDYAGGRRLSE
ncbi:MAG: hypothetical protein R2736_04120 [Solirubrobacterales bacterium]|jgi:hypothetical protein